MPSGIFSDLFDDLITCEVPPPARLPFVAANGGHEHKFSEGAVQLAYAAHLVRQCATEIHLHPDGQQVRFGFKTWLERYGFEHVEPVGIGHAQAGWYKKGVVRVRVHIRGGSGDVVSTASVPPVAAECKGGTINSQHAGVQSQLRRRLYEAVGQAFNLDPPSGGRRIAVVPFTDTTANLARRLAPRVAVAGVEIALVHRNGTVSEFGRA